MVGVFVSYARADIEFATRIRAELEARGADAFIEYVRLQTGNFVKQLGQAVTTRDYFIVILSPRSVDSIWVQAEIALALQTKRNIVPLLLEPCSMVNVFPLLNLQWVDFTPTSVYGDYTGALHKLCDLLGLPQAAPQPVDETPPPAEAYESVEPIPEQVEAQAAEALFEHVTEKAREEEIAQTIHAFGEDELDDLFASAFEMGDKNPEQAIYLYRRVLEIDPNYLGGKAQRLVEQLEIPLNQRRITDLMVRAENAKKERQWDQSAAFARDALAIDPSRNDILEFIVDTHLNHAEWVLDTPDWLDDNWLTDDSRKNPFDPVAKAILAAFESVDNANQKLKDKVKNKVRDLMASHINYTAEEESAVEALTLLRWTDALEGFDKWRWADSFLSKDVKEPNFDVADPEMSFRGWDNLLARAEIADLIADINNRPTKRKPSTIYQQKARIARAKGHLAQKEWAQAESVITDLTSNFKPDTEIAAQAKEIARLATENASCDVLYEKAVRAASKGQIKVALLFKNQIREECPDYGDLSGIFANPVPITRENVVDLPDGILIEGVQKVRHLWFSPDSKTILAAMTSVSVDMLSLIDVAQRKVIRTRNEKKHGEYLDSHLAAFSPDGGTIAYAYTTRTYAGQTTTYHHYLVLLDATTLQKTYEIAIKEESRALRFSPDGHLLAVGLTSGVSVYDVQQLQHLTTFKAKNQIRSLTFSPDSQYIAVGSYKHALVWRIDARPTMGGLIPPKPHIELKTIYWAEQIDFSPDGTRLYIGHDGVWDFSTRQKLNVHTDLGQTFALSPDGLLIAQEIYQQSRRGLCLWDAHTDETVFTQLLDADMSASTIKGLCFSPDGSLIAGIVGKEDQIMLWGLTL